MPNHVTNKLTCSEEVLAAITKLDEKGTLTISFDLIVPCPEEIQNQPHVFSSISDESKEEDDNSLLTEEEIITKQHTKSALECLVEELGVDNWYDFNIKYWGTKWDAYDVSIEEGVVTFDTAWSMPDAFYEALSRKFPKAVIAVMWADEDLGSNFGSGTFVNGVFEGKSFTDINEEGAMEVLMECKPYADEWFVKNDSGKWVWTEEE